MGYKQLLTLLAAALLITGCTLGTANTIRLKGTANPGQISLDKRMPVAIEATVENIANSTETVTVDVDDTEGLSVTKPERTQFTLKPGESRVVIFTGKLDETAVPGKYRIEISAVTQRGDHVTELVYLNVVAERGII